MASHSSTLAWKILWTEEPGRLQCMGSLRLGHDWATSLSLSLSCIGEGNGNPLQCSCLENLRDGGAWWAAIYGVTQSWTWLKWLSSSRPGFMLWLCCSRALELGQTTLNLHEFWSFYLYIYLHICIYKYLLFVYYCIITVLSSSHVILRAKWIAKILSYKTLCRHGAWGYLLLLSLLLTSVVLLPVIIKSRIVSGNTEMAKSGRRRARSLPK